MSNIVELRTTPESEREEVEQLPLFTLDGEEYSIPAKPKVNVALKYLRLARTESTDIAAAFLLEELLGDDAYEALMNYDELTTEDLTNIMQVAQKVIAGSLDDPKGG